MKFRLNLGFPYFAIELNTELTFGIGGNVP